MPELEALKRTVARERAARKEAESLLETKSRELYDANQRLSGLIERHRTVVETAGEGIITYNAEGTIQGANRSAKHIFGFETDFHTNISELFVSGHGTHDALFPASTCNESSTTDIVEENEIDAVEPYELLGVRSTGTTFPVEVTATVSSDEDFALYTVLLRDLTRRKKLEARLSHAQKMESVGQLAAGIAHEINTPIQFISDNARFLDGAIHDLFDILNLYEQLSLKLRHQETTSEILDAIDRKTDQIDYWFLREEFPGAIKQTIEGTEQVTTIVRAMKEFSHPATESKTSVDINRAIENAIAISTNYFRDIATIHLDLDPQLGLVPCLGAEMNQAFLNILTNAAEAIADTHRSELGRISVSTRMDEDEVEIRFEDDGPGIPAEVQSRIFDPFFTTKEVGKGMGQGLAFVYDLVVHKHCGTIDATSPPEGGTCFVIRLPKNCHQPGERRVYASSTN